MLSFSSIRTVAGVLVACVVVTSPGHAQVSLESLTELWKAKRYEEVVVPLIQLQDSVSGENLIRVEYMIATSLCRGGRAEYRANGIAFFDALITQYGPMLDPAFLNALQHERQLCSQAGVAVVTVMPLATTTYTTPASAEMAAYGGKMGFFECPGENAQGRGRFVVASGTKPVDITGRVWPRSQAGSARSQVVALLKNLPGYTPVAVDTVGQFVVASLGNQPSSWRREAGDLLSRQMQFFSTRFGMRIPDSMITLYLVPTEDVMKRVAVRLHGRTPPYRALGYSVLTDLSIVIRTSEPLGSALHENTHLMMKLNYPDAPAWLDEGLASIYEVSSFTGNDLVGMPNWRGQVLREFGYPQQQRVTLRQLLGMSYEQFHLLQSGDEFLQAVHYGLARYFVLYVQDQGKLAELLEALRHRHLANVNPATGEVLITQPSPTADLLTASQVLGVPPATLELDFSMWLAKVLPEKRRCP